MIKLIQPAEQFRRMYYRLRVMHKMGLFLKPLKRHKRAYNETFITSQ